MNSRAPLSGKWTRFTIRAFKPNSYPFEYIRASGLGLLLRMATSLGYTVLLIGPARSGKSFLMERICPNAIFNRIKDSLSDQPRIGMIDASLFPTNTTVGLDEIAHLPPGFLASAQAELSKRRMIYALQRETDLDRVRLRPLLQGRKVLVVNLLA